MKPLFYSMSLLLILATGCSQASQEEMNAQAKQQFDNKQYSQAIETYKKINDEHGETPETWQNIALTAYHAKDYAYAVNAADAGIRLIDSTGQATTMAYCRESLFEIRAMAHEGRGEIATAVNEYYALMGSTNKDIRIRAKSRLANLFLKNSKPDGALAFLLSALKDDISNATTNYNLAMLCNNTFELYGEALTFYHMANRSIPETAIQKKVIASEIKRIEDNRAQWAKSSKKKNESIKALYKAQRYSDILDILRPAIVENAESKYIKNIMIVLKTQNKLDEARAWGEFYLMINPHLSDSERNEIKNFPPFN